MRIGLHLEPTSLFISDDEWQDDETRDNFLESLLDILNIIDGLALHKILWTEGLENLFWTSPQLNPWREYGNYKLSIIPILYNKFNSNYEFVSASITEATLEPELYCPETLEEVKAEFLKLSDSLVTNEMKFHLILGNHNTKVDSLLVISSDGKTFNPSLVKGKCDYCKCIDYDKFFWPTSFSVEEIKKFRIGIEIARLAEFPKTNFRYAFEFRKSFIKDIIDIAEDKRKNVLLKLAKRLCSNAKEASEDPTLQDEYIGKVKEFRFRVTPRPSSTRIHYIFSGNATIEFLRYYGFGEHDDGL